MSGETWTPGPWIVDFDLCDEEGPLGVPEVNGRILDQDNCAVCQASTEANVFLISAAPELYEALNKMLELYIRLALSGDAGFWNPEDEPEVIVARAALKKARGES